MQRGSVAQSSTPSQAPPNCVTLAPPREELGGRLEIIADFGDPRLAFTDTWTKQPNLTPCVWVWFVFFFFFFFFLWGGAVFFRVLLFFFF